jgi:hypothetical protein
MKRWNQRRAITACCYVTVSEIKHNGRMDDFSCGMWTAKLH